MTRIKHIYYSFVGNKFFRTQYEDPTGGRFDVVPAPPSYTSCQDRREQIRVRFGDSVLRQTANDSAGNVSEDHRSEHSYGSVQHVGYSVQKEVLGFIDVPEKITKSIKTH